MSKITLVNKKRSYIDREMLLPQEKIAPQGHAKTRSLSQEELSYRSVLKRNTIHWMTKLREFHPYCYGSVARGDVSLHSDVDIVIDPAPSYKVEIALGEWLKRKIVQGTPNQTPKMVYQLGVIPNIHLSVPFVQLSNRENDFISFAGKLSLSKFQNGEYAIGVNKKLLLVEPMDNKGNNYHYTSIRDLPYHDIAKKINVGVDIILERIRVLSRRDDIGRTGLYIDYELNPSEEPEKVLKELASQRQELRRLLQKEKFIL